MELENDLKARIQQWLGDGYDDETKREIGALINQKDYVALTDAFYCDLEFGTGGIRGIMGVGTNRMNRYTVGVATQGLANFLINHYRNEQVKVAIAFDNRNNSNFFAAVCADVLTASGIQVYLYEHLRPTPMLSFAVRELDCHAGIMVTASHNPKEYNGYKVYGRDGGQLVSPLDDQVIQEVRNIRDISQVDFNGNPDLLTLIDENMDTRYRERIKRFAVYPEIGKQKDDLSIVYTSLHGTGITMVPDVLSDWGFGQVYVEALQAVTDGNFSTIESPNPEEREAFKIGLSLAETVNADIVLATDPDCDRVGVAVKSSKGEYVLLNGNQIGSLLVFYVLSGAKEKGLLNGRQFVAKTIVTTGLISEIARSFEVKEYEVLTGFKYIGEIITQLEGKETFLVGGEESYGYLIGDVVRDKDAIISAAIIAEMAAYYKARGQTLLDTLQSLYAIYGYYKEELVSITKKGKSGTEEILTFMARLRERPLRYLGGVRIVEIRDYQSSVSIDLLKAGIREIKLPKSNVLQFVSVEGDIITVRPSGTEPKIKFYCSSTSGQKESCEVIDDLLAEKIRMMVGDLVKLMD